MPEDDLLYMRHPARQSGGDYDGEIPGHNHFADQSVNSDLLNEGGEPEDVLLDTKNGKHYFATHQIARLNLREVEAISVPNENQLVLKDTSGQPVRSPLYSFKVMHAPTPCMRPHCIIQAHLEASLSENPPAKKVSRSKTIEVAIRRAFARIAKPHHPETSRRPIEILESDHSHSVIPTPDVLITADALVESDSAQPVVQGSSTLVCRLWVALTTFCNWIRK